MLVGTRKIVEKAENQGISIFHGDGTNPVVINEKEISLNGDRSTDEDHEWFVVTKTDNRDFEFCKTALKPYDAVVVSVLALMEEIAPGVLELSSDGDDDIFSNPPITINAVDVAQIRMGKV